MSLFEKVSGAKQILALLAKVDFADIQKAIALVNDIQAGGFDVSDDTIKAIQLAQLVAKYTEAKTDDHVLAAMAEVVASPGFKQLADIVEAMLESGGAVPVGSLPAEGIQLGSTDKEFIPLPVALQLAQIVVSIILYLRKNKQ